ncbi:AraC family transcriptional regulator [uncultured Kriegella sp.]|uniref:AraC family transcriptional regulator n=1 Tax=uncultured Kriegella sp. TaxID=1798910 RepID=UPI0030DCDEF9|tara:strand:+ start:33025 stop:33921 length:897 start_codon:yes stop_codon:yes gene_type:complete
MEDIPQMGLPELHKETGIKENKNHPGFLIFKAENVSDYMISGNPFRNVMYGLNFFIEGDGEINIDFNSYKPCKNSVHFCCPGQVVTAKGSFTNGIGVIFQKDFLLKPGAQQWVQSLPIFSRFLSSPVVELQEEDKPLFHALLREMEKEYYSDAILKYDALEALLTLMLVKLSRFYEKSNEEKISVDAQHIQNLEALINKQYKNNRSVVEYAAQLYMTPQNLNRITKKAIGKSVSELINERLIIEIKRYLVYTDMSSEEIAHFFNFYDNSYFIKTFKKAVGQTPKAFRKAQKHLLRLAL